MTKLHTKDNKEVILTHSSRRPDIKGAGGADATPYLWFKLESKWIRANTRNAQALRTIIESNTLLELKNKETIL